jgi:hypothetical protein
MATTSHLQSISLSADGNYQDTATAVYQVEYDSVLTNPYQALVLAQSAETGTPVPARRAKLLGTVGVDIYAMSINGAAKDPSRKFWLWTVSYSVPSKDEGGSDPGVDESNPLLWAPVYQVEYMEREYVIQKARNVITLPHGDGKGGSRAADTMGPIVNAAGKKPDEPLVDTEQCEVLYIRKNFPSLAAIVSLNRTYKRTTNSDEVQGYGTRQLRYMLCESQGEQTAAGITYWPGEIRIMAEDTTSLELDNVGCDYWDTVESDWVRAKDAKGNDMGDPINLTTAGGKGGDNTTTVLYRHLEAVAYAPLFS